MYSAKTISKTLSFAAVSAVGAALLSLLVTEASAAPSGKKNPTPRDVQVDTVKEAYWNRTSDGDIEVVQNRQFSKKNRLSVQAGVGSVSTDPFLSVKSVGGGLSYHFSETLGVTALYRKYMVSDSNYLTELQQGLITGANSSANTNRPNSFMGGEFVYSPLYGKISLSGASIVHYDAHILLGLGVTDTQSGKYVTPSIGFGPQFYLSNALALRLDYRIARFKEEIRETVLTTRRIATERTNYSHQITVALEVFL